MIIRLSDTHASNPPIDASALHAILLHLPSGVMIVDAVSSTILYRNAKASSLLRDTPMHDGSYDSYLQNACHADGRRYLLRDFPIARALAGELVEEAEVIYQRAWHAAQYVLITAIPVFDTHGIVAKAIVLLTDISLQRHAEHEMRDTARRLALALEGANMMPWSLDIGTGHVVADASWFFRLGYLPSQVRLSVNAVLGIIHPCDRSRLLHHWHDNLEGHTSSCEVSCRLRTAQHTWRWTLIRAEITERARDGKALRAVGALIDIDRAKRAELALRDSEERFRSTFEHAAIGIATISTIGRWLTVNPKISETLGYTADELVNNCTIEQILHADDTRQFNSALQKLLSNEVRTVSLEQRCMRKDGRTAWIELTLSSVCDEHVGIKYLIAILKDKTSEKRSQQHIDRVQTHLRMATKIAGLGFWEWDLERGEISFSEHWKVQHGFTDEEGRSSFDEWQSRIHDEDRERVLAYLDAYVSAPTPEYAVEFRTYHRNGGYRWICVRGMPVLDRHSRLQKIVGTHLDITEQKNAEESTRQRAQHDVLTGLPNRGLLYEFSEHLIASARRASTPLAVLFLDLDHFKVVNDTYGHRVGDCILKEVSVRLAQLMRAEDLIGRLGGDEFVAILPKIGNADDAAVVAAKALDSLREPYHVDGLELRLSPSIGISLFPKDGDTLDLLIQRADAAMYRVKHGERNNFRFFVPEWNEDPHQRTDLERRLRLGLERGEFDLHYQPIIDTRNGRVIGVEALLRWLQDGVRFIDPSMFLPIAETSGLIVPLGEWILQRACRQHCDWLQQGLPPMSIAVNVSAVQFRRGEFQDSIGDAIHAAGVDPGFIEIELAESTVMKNFDNTVDIMRGLKHLGLKIAIDDFGTGYSNLSQLSRLPIDKLKVDRSFVRYLSRDRSCLAITDAIIAMGRSLGIEVVAEGIETEQDMLMLKNHACHHAQGFHIGRPMPGQQFVQWYNEHRMH